MRDGFTPASAEFRPFWAHLRPVSANFRPERADSRSKRADSRSKRADFRPKRADFRLDCSFRLDCGTDGHIMDIKKFVLVLGGYRPSGPAAQKTLKVFGCGNSHAPQHSPSIGRV